MLSTGHDHGYGEDRLRGGRNCRTSTRIFHFSIERNAFWPQAHRATPVGWKVVHDVELYPPPDGLACSNVRSNLT
jgi:hypothetical protein